MTTLQLPYYPAEPIAQRAMAEIAKREDILSCLNSHTFSVEEGVIGLTILPSLLRMRLRQALRWAQEQDELLRVEDKTKIHDYKRLQALRQNRELIGHIQTSLEWCEIPLKQEIETNNKMAAEAYKEREATRIAKERTEKKRAEADRVTKEHAELDRKMWKNLLPALLFGVPILVGIVYPPFLAFVFLGLVAALFVWLLSGCQFFFFIPFG